MLAQFFPEFDREFKVSRRRSLWALLEAFPAPTDIAQKPKAAIALLRKASRGLLSLESAQKVVDLARTSSGDRMTAPDRRFMQSVVREMRRCQKELDRVDAEIETAVNAQTDLEALRHLLGPVTVAVLFGHLGSPAQYGTAHAFQKACGLNLKERSSGQHTGRLHITKRGPGLVRKYLYLAALRLLQRDPIARAWYHARAAYSDDQKQKAVMALVRKLTLAVVHVARGARFDARLLFDVRRLTIGDDAPEATLPPDAHLLPEACA